MSRKETLKYKRGDVFLIPLPLYGWGVGQILGKEKKCLDSIAVSLSDQLLQNETDPVHPITKANCISLLMTFPNNIESRRWKIIKKTRVKTPLLYYPFWKQLRLEHGIGVTILAEEALEAFIGAFQGQLPWDLFERGFDRHVINPERNLDKRKPLVEIN